jgi:hypothetical protein
MNYSIRLLDFKRVGYLAAIFAVLLATVLPSLAFAAQTTARSIELTSASVDAIDVIYKVKFTPVTDAGAVVIDFCNDSPALGATCTPPEDFSVAGAAGSNGFTVNGTPTASKIVLTGTITQPTPVSFDLTNIDNPSEAGTIYARIVTFDNATSANLYSSASTTSATGYKDHGSVAMSITPTINVSGSVLESLVFCTSGEDFDEDGCAGETTAPDVKLGTDGVLGNAVSDGTVYSMISTNAATGAVVNLRSNAEGCGGLVLAGADPEDEDASCGIKPVVGTAAAIANNAALFGLRFGTIEEGTGDVGTTYGYSSGANYFMNYIDGDETGVTSTYGAPIYDTNELPNNGAKVPLIFGANISDDTPAGAYSAALNLIATGKF